MSKLRLLFVKEGTAAYISHLDLLRTVQRAFPRTELEIKHSQGFHPHPIISIVLPLPVAQVRMIAAVREAVETFEPRVRVTGVTFDQRGEAEGRLVPRVEVEPA